MLDKMEVLEKPSEVRADMRIRLEPRVTSGNDVLRVSNLSKSFPGQPLFSDLNFEIRRGERVAIIGNNGTGKTTILKILNGVVAPDGGRLSWEPKCRSAIMTRNIRCSIWIRRSFRRFQTPIRI